MLSSHELTTLLSRPEGEYLERKESVPNRGEIRRALVAFANSVPEGAHGVLLLGQADNLKVTGISDIDSTQKLVRDIAAKDCYPPVPLQLSIIPAESLNVLAVVVEPSKARPHFSGPAFVRRGSESVNATPEQYEELIASRVEKARVLIAHKGKLVSINSLDDREWKKGGDIPVWQRDYRINACDAHHVQLEDMNYHMIHPIPLSRIEITKGIVPPRLLLVIDQKLVR